MARLQTADNRTLTADVRNALVAVENAWPGHLPDTLCCGTLGSVEFFSEALLGAGPARSSETGIAAASRRHLGRDQTRRLPVDR